MKQIDDLELLRQFSRTRSEELFATLVHRYAPLVYTVGLRVAGSPEAARDITQRVFIDLFHRLPKVIGSLESAASRAVGPASLSGWLHRAARYEALDFIRAENRRQTRERIAMELHAQSSPNDWPAIRPLLDEALDSLDEPDRQAVLLRYFEDASYRDVAARFGITEDAAQKRVSRAVDRLREILLRKGVATSAASLAAGLSTGAIEAMPSDLPNAITLAAFRQTLRITTTPTSFLTDQLLSRRLMLPLGVGMAVLLTVLFLQRPRSSLDANSVAPVGAPEHTTQAPLASTHAAVADPMPTMETSSISATQMVLRVVAADTGLPLQGVSGAVGVTMDGVRAIGLATLSTDANGQATVHFTNDIFGLSIELSLDGYAGTRLAWKPARGQTIPREYTLRMATAPLIGGFVVDESGAPVGDVGIQFHLPDRFDGPIGQIESHFCTFAPQVRTDSNGYFETKRIAREILKDMEIAPWRTDFLSHGWLSVSNVVNGVEQLLSRSFVLALKRGLELRGRVVDQFNSPLPGIRVTFGSYYSNQRSSTSTLSGDFVLKGCTPGTNIISAFDFKRGAAFQIVNVTNPEPALLQLRPFRTLYVQTVDSTGAPVPNVKVTWQSVDEFGKTSNGSPGRTTPQYSFDGFTDHNGELIWTYAPADRVLVSFYPKHHGQRHNLLLDADGLVQTVTLEENYPPQIIQGTVRDAITQTPISGFRVRRGYPRTRNGVVTPVWYSGFRDVVDFAGGSFRFEFDYYSVDEPPSRFEHMFEFSAEGYEPVVSRVIRGDEGNVQLDLSLNPEAH